MHNIFDWRDRQLTGPKGYITLRLYESGWLARFTPFDATTRTETVEGMDVDSACAFASAHLS